MTLLRAVLALLAISCSSAPGGPAQVVSAGTPEVGVRRELVRVDSPAPPPNPVTQEATPGALNHTTVVRYRQDVEPPAPVTAVILAMPGFIAGAAAFDQLGRAAVQRGIAAGAPVEVWAVDRRSNQLEDLTGMAVARDAGNPELATAYYFQGALAAGRTFGAFLPQSAAGYESEWGLAAHIDDLEAVLAVIPGDHRGHVFLLGHSLGGSFAEAYGAWRFADGGRGADHVAGLILIDGALGSAPVSQAEYETTGLPGTLGPTPSLEQIRADSRYYALPFLGTRVYALSEIMAQRALVAPSGVVTDPVRDGVLELLLGLGSGQVPHLTNRAALGFGFDVAFCPLPFVAASLGQPTGGPTETYRSFLGGTLRHPTDPAATYDWIDAPQATPPGLTPVTNLARSYSFPGTNFTEWYFPNRLPLDLGAVAGGAVAETGWQASHGLRAFDGPRNDAPVLGISGVFVSPEQYRALAGRLAPTVGPGRRHAGAARTTDQGYRVIDGAGFSHVDLLTADDGPGNPVPAAISAFVADQVVPGTITVRIPGD
jgi:hypothetical protein